MRGGSSRRYRAAKRDIDLLTAPRAADYLGVSVVWLRKHISPTEWHHCNFRYGASAVAHFWSEIKLDEALSAKTEDYFPLLYGPNGRWHMLDFRRALHSAQQSKQRRTTRGANKKNQGGQNGKKVAEREAIRTSG